MQHIASQWGLQLIFRMHNSDPTPQGVENINTIMQTITYPHDRTHFQGTGWIVPFDLREWN
jgi:hypothetical protein